MELRKNVLEMHKKGNVDADELEKKRRERLLDFSKILAIMRKNFIVLFRDKARIIPLMLFPIFMILVFGFSTGSIPKNISTVIVSYDNSLTANQVIQQISSNDVFNVKYIVSTEGEARNLLDEGKVSVIIEIPPNFEKNINAEIQTGITVIVDESDSAVGSTAENTMMNIVSKISSSISMTKIAMLQQSVGASVYSLQSYIAQQSMICSAYENIEGLNTASDAQLTAANEIVTAQTKAMIANAPILTAYYPFLTKAGYNVTENNTYVGEPPNYQMVMTQIAYMQQASGLISSADNNIVAANSIASQSGSNLKKLSASYSQNVLEPVSNINVFMAYDDNSLLQPVTYISKPAYGTGKRAVDFAIPSIIALIIFQGALMGMGRAVAGEKRDGSLTRVFLTPTSNATIIAGTLLFYMLFEVFRSTFIILVSIFLFGITIQGNLLLLGLVILIYAAISTSLGMMISCAVRTEQQFMAMSMLISMPSLFLAGAFFPLEAMPKALQIIAQFLPVTYAGQALRGVMVKGFDIVGIAYPLLILLLFLAIVLGGLFIVFKRDIE